MAADAPAERSDLLRALNTEPRIAIVADVELAALPRSVARYDPDAIVIAGDDDQPGRGDFDVPTVRLRDGASAPGRTSDRAGALLARASSADELCAAVLAVAAGLIVQQPAGEQPRSQRPAASAPSEALSSRERDVLALLADGRSNKAIAHELGISDHTVKTHIASIFSKFGVSSRTEAVTAGVRFGIVML